MVSFLNIPVSLPLLLLLVACVADSDGYKLSAEENAQLQKTCGVGMKEQHPYARKVLNGTAAGAGEAPWTVAVYLSDNTDKTVYTTGTLISRRHILTYDGLFVSNTSEGIMFRHTMEVVAQKCDGQDWILPKDLVRRVSVFLNTLRADRVVGRNELKLRSITVLNGCEQPLRMNRVAVLELVKAIKTEQKAKPVCISSVPAEPSYHFYGYGDNRGAVIDARLRHANVSVVACPSDSDSDDVFCVTSRHALCNGDFGGAAIRKRNNAIQAFGIYVEGPYDCSTATEDDVFKFASLKSLAEPICEMTGVCNPDLIEEITEDDVEGSTNDTDHVIVKPTPTPTPSGQDSGLNTDKLTAELRELKEQLKAMRDILTDLQSGVTCKKNRKTH